MTGNARTHLVRITELETGDGLHYEVPEAVAEAVADLISHGDEPVAPWPVKARWAIDLLEAVEEARLKGLLDEPRGQFLAVMLETHAIRQTRQRLETVLEAIKGDSE